MSQDKLRLDKWLWAVRIFKTRVLATEQCRSGHVKIQDKSCKPSHHIRVGEEIAVRRDGFISRYKVLGLVDKRVSAKIAVQYVENITPQELLEQRQLQRLSVVGRRERGAGRPTKKERRDIDRLRHKSS